MSLYKHIKVEDAVKEHAELMQKLREECKEDIAECVPVRFSSKIDEGTHRKKRGENCKQKEEKNKIKSHMVCFFRTY